MDVCSWFNGQPSVRTLPHERHATNVSSTATGRYLRHGTEVPSAPAVLTAARAAHCIGLYFATAMKVLILDDHALIRDALARALADLDPSVTVLQAGEPHAALAIVDAEPGLDLVLLDLALPAMSGMQVLRALRERHPAVAVVVISANADRDNVRRVIEQGVSGFIPKSSTNEVLKNALRLVLGGGVYLPPEVLGLGAAPVVDTPADRTTPADIGLTPSQAKILARMMNGESNKLICRELNLAESTVKNQITLILKALNVSSRTQAVLAVSKLGLVLPETGVSR